MKKASKAEARSRRYRRSPDLAFHSPAPQLRLGKTRERPVTLSGLLPQVLPASASRPARPSLACFPSLMNEAGALAKGRQRRAPPLHRPTRFRIETPMPFALSLRGFGARGPTGPETACEGSHGFGERAERHRTPTCGPFLHPKDVRAACPGHECTERCHWHLPTPLKEAAHLS